MLVKRVRYAIVVLPEVNILVDDREDMQRDGRKAPFSNAGPIGP